MVGRKLKPAVGSGGSLGEGRNTGEEDPIMLPRNLSGESTEELPWSFPLRGDEDVRGFSRKNVVLCPHSMKDKNNKRINMKDSRDVSSDEYIHIHIYIYIILSILEL